MYRKFFKRFLDIIFSALGLIILSPILLITYILVVIFLGFPGIFKQERPGKDEKIFELYKFRTMTNAKDKKGRLLPDEKRLTKFGIFLRSTSIDELPELFNILKGDMSFVGPRPLLVEYLPYYTKKEHHRHDVRPGLTGLAQVEGRNYLNWSKRFKLDIKYIDTITLKQDVVIIIKTVQKVITRKDITTSSNLVFKNLNIERKNVKTEAIIKTADYSIYEQHKNDIYNCLYDLTNSRAKSKKLTKRIEYYLLDKTAIIHCAIINDKVISLIWGYEIAKSIIHINYFTTQKAYRGQGVGNKLLKSFFKKGYKYELLVDKNNPAIKLYEKYGFKKKAHSAKKYKMERL